MKIEKQLKTKQNKAEQTKKKTKPIAFGKMIKPENKMEQTFKPKNANENKLNGKEENQMKLIKQKNQKSYLLF